MRIRLAREEDAEYVSAARRLTYESLGGHGDSEWARPLPVGIHLVATDGALRIGMAEGYLYHRVYESLAKSPFAGVQALEIIGLPQLSSMRTVWVEPAYRHGLAFAYLTVLMAEHGAAGGATHATASTLLDHPAYMTYRALGGEPVGMIQAMGIQLAVLIFDLGVMLRSPLYQRAQKCKEGVSSMVGGP